MSNNNKEEDRQPRDFELLGDKLKPELSGTWIVNPKREEELSSAYSLTTKIISGNNLQTSYSSHEPFPACGVIDIEGDYLHVRDPKQFIKLMEAADILYISPDHNGRVGMEIFFNGMAQKVGD